MSIEKTCEHCQATFRVQPRRAGRKFCSAVCKHAHEALHGRPAAHRTPVEFSCKTCGNSFTMMQSYVTAYRKRHGKDPMYCSMPCSDIGRRKDSDTKNSFTCEQCGKTQPLRRKTDGNFYYGQKFCDRTCKAEHQRQRALKRFNDGHMGRHVKRHGYVWLSVPSLVTGKKHAVMEHRYNMSKHLGRALFAEETVHHKDGNRANNSLDNLELFSSRHGPGQRVVDKVAFAIEMLRLYPEHAREIGVSLCDLEHCPVAPTPP